MDESELKNVKRWFRVSGKRLYVGYSYPYFYTVYVPVDQSFVLVEREGDEDFEVIIKTDKEAEYVRLLVSD